jgi:hypothetical protein
MRLQKISKNYIEESECQSLDTKCVSLCFYITWENYTYADISKLRKSEHIHRPNRGVSTEKRYIVKYVCFSLKTTTNNINYIQGYIQFTSRVTPSTVANIFVGCRVMKTKMLVKKDHSIFDEHGIQIKLNANDSGEEQKNREVVVVDKHCVVDNNALRNTLMLLTGQIKTKKLTKSLTLKQTLFHLLDQMNVNV